MTIQRQRRIEELLVEEFQANGYKVKNDKGNTIALVETLRSGGLVEHDMIDLTQLAAHIDGRLW